MDKPKKWIDVYPQGTKDGDEEQRFFIALARHPEYKWRSTEILAKQSGLSEERVEKLILKYHKKGMIFQNPKNKEQWGYWERVPDMIKEKKSVSDADKQKRIEGL